jgi:hypothetical protein
MYSKQIKKLIRPHPPTSSIIAPAPQDNYVHTTQMPPFPANIKLKGMPGAANNSFWQYVTGMSPVNK